MVSIRIQTCHQLWVIEDEGSKELDLPVILLLPLKQTQRHDSFFSFLPFLIDLPSRPQDKYEENDG